jgi:DNA-binding transcriptional LysR family regulator
MLSMREAQLRNLDLNLLVPLHALLEERHVTRAAKRSFLSQPAMSRALERLREMLGDPLLVRSGRIYERTVRGERVLRELETLIPRLKAIVGGVEFDPFDPARSQERLRVALTDHASTILLPSLVARVRRAATHVKVEVSAWRTLAYEDVEAGTVDTALSAEEGPPALESEVILNLDFVCVVGSAVGVRTSRFTLKQYLQFSACAGRNVGWSTNLGGSPSGAACEAARRAQSSILCASHLCHCSKRSGPHCAPRIGKVCRWDGCGIWRRIAVRFRDDSSHNRTMWRSSPPVDKPLSIATTGS